MAARGKRSPAKEPAASTPHDEGFEIGQTAMVAFLDAWPMTGFTPGPQPEQPDPEWELPTAGPIKLIPPPLKRPPAELTGGSGDAA